MSNWRTLFFLLVVGVVLSGCSSDSSSIRYVAIGASDATGIGAQPLSDGYVFLIDNKLGGRIKMDVDLTNLGIPGAEADEFVEIELPVAKEVEPDLVTIWAGPNDLIGGRSVEDFENDIETLLSELQEDTAAFIAIATLPDLTLLPRFQDDPDPDVTVQRVERYNQAIVRQAERFDVAIVDLSPIAPDGNLVSDLDGFHPSSEGHLKIAELFLDVIVPAFGG